MPDKSLKIVQVNATYGYGSTGVIMRDLGSLLSKQGHIPFYVYQRKKGSVINGKKVGNEVDWKLHALFCRLFGSQGFYSTYPTKDLLAYLDKLQPDIVHLHNLHSNFLHIGLLLEYLGKKDIATVITLHDCWFFTGKCFHYIDANCSRFQTGCGECPKRMAPPCSVLKDTSTRIWEVKNQLLHMIPRLAIVGCSKWIAEEALKGFLSDKRVTFIHNGTDTDIFTPKANKLRQELCIPENMFVVLGMSNKWLTSRNSLLLSRLNQLDGVKIVITGCTQSEYRFLKEKYPSIIPVTYIEDSKRLAEFYNMADVFINPTHADTLPTVNMESICCGTPVITYNVGGSPEIISPECGISVKEDDIEGMVNAIAETRYKEFPNCAQYGEKHYNRDECFKKYIDVYQTLLA